MKRALRLAALITGLCISTPSHIFSMEYAEAKDESGIIKNLRTRRDKVPYLSNISQQALQLVIQQAGNPGPIDAKEAAINFTFRGLPITIPVETLQAIFKKKKNFMAQKLAAVVASTKLDSLEKAFAMQLASMLFSQKWLARHAGWMRDIKQLEEMAAAILKKREVVTAFEAQQQQAQRDIEALQETSSARVNDLTRQLEELTLAKDAEAAARGATIVYANLRQAHEKTLTLVAQFIRTFVLPDYPLAETPDELPALAGALLSRYEETLNKHLHSALLTLQTNPTNPEILTLLAEAARVHIAELADKTKILVTTQEEATAVIAEKERQRVEAEKLHQLERERQEALQEELARLREEQEAADLAKEEVTAKTLQRDAHIEELEKQQAASKAQLKEIEKLIEQAQQAQQAAQQKLEELQAEQKRQAEIEQKAQVLRDELSATSAKVRDNQKRNTAARTIQGAFFSRQRRKALRIKEETVRKRKAVTAATKQVTVERARLEDATTKSEDETARLEAQREELAKQQAAEDAEREKAVQEEQEREEALARQAKEDAQQREQVKKAKEHAEQEAQKLKDELQARQAAEKQKEKLAEQQRRERTEATQKAEQRAQQKKEEAAKLQAQLDEENRIEAERVAKQKKLAEQQAARKRAQEEDARQAELRAQRAKEQAAALQAKIDAANEAEAILRNTQEEERERKRRERSEASRKALEERKAQQAAEESQRLADEAARLKTLEAARAKQAATEAEQKREAEQAAAKKAREVKDDAKAPEVVRQALSYLAGQVGLDGVNSRSRGEELRALVNELWENRSEFDAGTFLQACHQSRLNNAGVKMAASTFMKRVLNEIEEAEKTEEAEKEQLATEQEEAAKKKAEEEAATSTGSGWLSSLWG